MTAMDFRERASREVSALVDRLVSDAEGCRQAQLDVIQDEHEAAMTMLRRQFEEQSQRFEARIKVGEQQAVEMRSQLDVLRAESEAQRRALHAAQAEAAVAQAEAVAQCDRATAAASVEAELIETRAALAASQEELAASHEELAASQEELAVSHEQFAASHEEAERLTEQFERALEELRVEHVNMLREQALARTVLPLDELIAVFGSLASASTPSAVLAAVVAALGREFSRVALFRLRGARLECMSHVGFEFEGDIAKIVIPTSVDSLLTRATNSNQTHSFVSGAGDDRCDAPFGGAPACAVALPLVSGDATVAVVYADDSDQLEFGAVPSPVLVKFAELVWQYAILVLRDISAKQKTLAVSPSQRFDRRA
jgi:hypothetical protein